MERGRVFFDWGYWLGPEDEWEGDAVACVDSEGTEGVECYVALFPTFFIGMRRYDEAVERRGEKALSIDFFLIFYPNRCYCLHLELY